MTGYYPPSRLSRDDPFMDRIEAMCDDGGYEEEVVDPRDPYADCDPEEFEHYPDYVSVIAVCELDSDDGPWWRTVNFDLNRQERERVRLQKLHDDECHCGTQIVIMANGSLEVL